MALGGAVALAMLAACGDPYLHNNPYDPVDSVAITVTGPDTLFSDYQSATYAATVTPAFPDSAVQWFYGTGVYETGGGKAFWFGNSGVITLGGPSPLWPDGYTLLVSAGIGAMDTVPLTVTVGPVIPITIWRHSGSKAVFVTQRIAHIQLRCPDAHACDALAAGGAWSVWADATDALQQPIYALFNPTANPCSGVPVIATFVTRDTSVASVSPVCVRVATVTARRPGSTWIVAAHDSLLDSLQLVVR